MKRFDVRSIRPLLVMLAASIVSVTIILVLYFYNNRYTQRAGQPYQGILDLTAEGQSAAKLRWLTAGWEYYEDALLGPEDFTGKSLPEPVIVSLGKYG